METKTSTASESRTTGLRQARRELNAILGDHQIDWATRLLRLQGWRGSDLDRAIAAGHAHRLGPGFCTIGAAAVAVSGSWPLALAFMTTAVVGVVASNHPVEAIYNRLAPGLGRSPLPPNRAAKRLGCAFGTVFFGASAVALMFGAGLLGQALAASFALVAGFVTVTNICVPSAVFVAVFGTDRSTASRLI